MSGDAANAETAERDRIIRLSRDVRRAMYENGVTEDVLKGWSAFAGWMKQGCPADPDLRGPVEDADTTLRLVLTELRHQRARSRERWEYESALDDAVDFVERTLAAGRESEDNPK